MIIKVCGLIPSPENETIARMKAVSHLGFIFAEHSPRFTESTFESAGKERVGVFVNAPESFVHHCIRKHRLTTVQFHGDESPHYCHSFRNIVTVIKAIGVEDQKDFTTAENYISTVDLLLFDTKSTQRGGTGKSFNWNLVENYTAKIPFLLSGGIGPDSIPELQQFSHPQWIGIDLNSRFEQSPGIKNPALFPTFLEQLEHANTSLYTTR
jgi:phosphoribosylanthranilate isomerase